MSVFIAFRVVFGCLFLITGVYAVSCPRGTFISQSASSGCQPCPNGTFSDRINSTRCLKCNECPHLGKHYRVTKACSPTSNIQCKCDPGFYFFKGSLFCLKCRPCRKGRGVVRNCTENSNTVCAPCKKGETYSDKKDLSRCKPCSKCEKGDTIEEICTRKSNTVCVNARVRNVSKHKKWLVNKSTNSTIIAPSSTDRKFTIKKGRPSTTRNSTETINQWTHPPGQRITSVDDVNTQNYEIALVTLVGVTVLAFVALIAVLCLLRRRPVERLLAIVLKNKFRAVHPR